MQAKTYMWTLLRLAFGAAASLSLQAHVSPERHPLLFFVLFAAFAFALAQPLFAWLRTHVPRMSTGRALATAAALWVIGFGLTYALPVPIAPHDRSGNLIELEVTALGSSPTSSGGTEVWFAIEADGHRVPSAEVRHGANWQPADGMLRTTGPGPSAHWRGRAETAQVVMVSHRWSGRARIVVNGKSHELDLHSNAAANILRTLPLTGDANPHLWMQFPDRTLKQRLTQMLDALLIAFALYVLHAALVSAPAAPSQPSPPTPLWRASVRYALPSWAVSACLLAVFWPGVMSNDSIGQWSWAGNGIASDWHPVYHTLLISIARRIWDTPGFVAMLQAGALGLSSGYLIAVAERVARTSTATSHFASWCCALMPMIAFTSITLWKDVPYAASVVAITAATASVLFLDTPRLSRPLAFCVTLAVLLVCVLFRHNGPPVALAALFIVFAFSRANRKAVVLLALGLAGLAMILKGPVTDALGVKRSNVAFTLYAHHIAAHLEAGESAPNPESRAAFNQIVKKPGAWPYRCSVVDITIFNPRFDIDEASRRSTELRDAWLQMASRDPGTELRHLACVSSLVWLMDDSGQAPLYEAGPSIYASSERVQWVQPGPEVQQASFAPTSAEAVAHWLEKSRQFNLLWRPAAWMYLLLLAAWVAASRLNDWRIALLPAPILVHSAVLAVANVAQDARYQLPVFIVALALAPALLRSSRHRVAFAPGTAPAPDPTP